jgi:hypothetical protein
MLISCILILYKLALKKKRGDTHMMASTEEKEMRRKDLNFIFWFY